MKKIATLMTSLALFNVGSAMAADAAPEHTITANVTLASEYRYRGIMQSFGQPAIQGGFDYAHSSGFYAGNWNSSISWLTDTGVAQTGSLEMDLYAGYKTEVGAGVTVDVGGLYYYYPAKGIDKATFSNPNTFELYAAASYGPATLKYSHALTDTFGNKDSKNSYYVDLSINQDLGFFGLTANAHVGYQKLKGATDDGSYTDWKLGATKDLGNGFSLAAAYIDTNAKKSFYTYNDKFFGKATGVVTLTKTF